MSKDNKEKVDKLLNFKELLEKQNDFINEWELDELKDENDFNNYLSTKENQLTVDNDGFIDYEKHEEDE